MNFTPNIIVPGRGHALSPEGDLILTASAVSRVDTLVEYYEDNADNFEDRGGLIDFEGGWAEAAAGIPRPPEELREGRLMRQRAEARGAPAQLCVEGIESTTTMDNMLQARRHFLAVGRLSIVTQVSQADRFLFCAGKVFPDTELSIIEAPGEDDQAIIEDENRLLRQSRLLYGWARGPRMLHVADRIGVMAGRLAGLRPAEKYGATG